MVEQIFCEAVGCFLSLEEYNDIMGDCGDAGLMSLIKATGLVEALKPLETLVASLNTATDEEKVDLLMEHNIQFKPAGEIKVDAIVDILVSDAPVQMETVTKEVREFKAEGGYSDVVNLNERYTHNRIEWQYDMIGGLPHAPIFKTTLNLDGFPVGFAIKPTKVAGKRSVAQGVIRADAAGFMSDEDEGLQKGEYGTDKVRCDRCDCVVNPDGHIFRCKPKKQRVPKDFAFERIFGDQVFDTMALIAISMMRGRIKGSKLINAYKVELTNRDWMAKLFKLLICAGALLPKKAHGVADLFEILVVIQPNIIRLIVTIMTSYLKRRVLEQ